MSASDFHGRTAEFFGKRLAVSGCLSCCGQWLLSLFCLFFLVSVFFIFPAAPPVDAGRTAPFSASTLETLLCQTEVFVSHGLKVERQEFGDPRDGRKVARQPPRYSSTRNGNSSLADRHRRCQSRVVGKSWALSLGHSAELLIGVWQTRAPPTSPQAYPCEKRKARGLPVVPASDAPPPSTHTLTSRGDSNQLGMYGH